MHGYLAPHFDGIQSTHSVRIITVGSTFEHHFDSIEPDQKGEKRLLGIAESILPGIRSKVIRTENWASIRVHRPPDRKPFVARQYSERGIWGLTGFGSKGLLLAPTAARRLVTELEEQDRASLS
jgi:glycine/D-amino acid oxidase-like deaminating enzyme